MQLLVWRCGSLNVAPSIVFAVSETIRMPAVWGDDPSGHIYGLRLAKVGLDSHPRHHEGSAARPCLLTVSDRSIFYLAHDAVA